MKFDDLCFTLKNNGGRESKCDILKVIPNKENRDEPYLIYTDYSLDDDDEFVNLYGKLIKLDNEYVLKNIENKEVIDYIVSKCSDETVCKINSQVMNNLK